MEREGVNLSTLDNERKLIPSFVSYVEQGAKRNNTIDLRSAWLSRSEISGVAVARQGEAREPGLGKFWSCSYHGNPGMDALFFVCDSLPLWSYLSCRGRDHFPVLKQDRFELMLGLRDHRVHCTNVISVCGVTSTRYIIEVASFLSMGEARGLQYSPNQGIVVEQASSLGIHTPYTFQSPKSQRALFGFPLCYRFTLPVSSPTREIYNHVESNT
ncbi:hypothetical protein RRG08_059075 [Elysia crispata]|uniref:Uncharacterized protein n=1 Tax=Elysia crispata TaxID=231223 RepID=A0AAE1ECW7_9GAST|nr:hypothetical protein RRG08_059075 [Elysia crispata]